MMQTEQGKLTLEDKRELDIQIKKLEEKIKEMQSEGLPEWIFENTKLRKLRRQRDAK